jgi:FKBP-type peptidyl-prolyl cis-trans isomerase FklB
MKQHLLAVLGLGLLVGAAQAQDKQADDKKAFKNEREKVSYAIGMSTGASWKRNEIDVDLDAVGKGIKDSVTGTPTLLTETEAREVLNNFGKELNAKRQEKQKLAGEKNKKEGEAFLAENKKKDGVITLPSGLQYKILNEGKGESPKADDNVSVNYRGTLIDGTEFDSSEKHGQAITRKVTGFVPGWTEALQLMKPGSKWQLFVPSDLAYRERGAPPSIGPDATLIFDIELVSVTHPAPTAPAQPLTSDIIKVPSAEELKKGAKIETIKPEDIEKEKAKH